MENFNSTTKRKSTFRVKLIAWLMLTALLLQTFSMCCFAATGGKPIFNFTSPNKGGTVSGIGRFESDEVIAQLKKDFLGSINKDLVQKIEDLELRGEVGAIITFSEDSLISSFTASNDSGKMTFAEYRSGSAAAKLQKKLSAEKVDVLFQILLVIILLICVFNGWKAVGGIG